ncbi:sporulation-delaying protein SdpB family protein [Phytohabitans suffuscus]|uniref:HTTM-like domain-containing protein n=1 Tax=Phytohabitans suffuscus TaxID=624315 RepID=A0A6F8YU82_9ACTN|nr:sporulation-delaying protein SdpB family protein [Phytohabitans suffuscus]BCB89606.1 hypothetical protein Psuf_069190 [Phytohabitans suffuscus]
MLTRLGHAARRWVESPPWSNVYGLARTLLALGTLGTLVFSPVDALFTPAQGIPPAPHCGGIRAASLFCVVGQGHLEVARWVAVAILVVVASGWRPALTAVPHWWVAVSLHASATLLDGGDQVTAVLTLLLLPVALTDRRRWHWQPPVGRHDYATLAAVVGMFLIRVQVAGIYLQASVAKLGVAEWRDGTALYYWLNHPMFGAPMWLRGALRPFLSWGPGVATLTWGTLVLEFALAIGLFLPKRRWAPLLVGGLALHGGIALLMGLWSFSLAMFAALVLYLRPWDRPLALPAASTASRGGWALALRRPYSREATER